MQIDPTKATTVRQILEILPINTIPVGSLVSSTERPNHAQSCGVRPWPSRRIKAAWMRASAVRGDITFEFKDLPEAWLVSERFPAGPLS